MNTAEAMAARTSGRTLLAEALRDSHRRTLSLLAAYADRLGEDLVIPYSTQLNPPCWEVGHIAWFQDYWISRNPQRARGVQADPDHHRPAGRLKEADAWYNSSHVAHPSRWTLPLPDLGTTRAYLAAVLDDTLALLANTTETDDDLYFFRLVLFHEDMHSEAAIYMAQALSIPLPETLIAPPAALPPLSTLKIPGNTGNLGYPDGGFAFDNELSLHGVELAAFEIDSCVVSWERYLPFLEATGTAPPRYLRKQGSRMAMAACGQLADLAPRHPGDPFDVVRSRGLVPLGWPAIANGSRVGICRQQSAGFCLGRGLGVDVQSLSALSRLCCPPLPGLFRPLVR